MADAHKNFAYSTIAAAPSPAASGTSLDVAAGQGTLFPAVPFNATIWPTGTQPTSTNAEIVRVTNISTDTFTITRSQESTSARTIVVGDQIAAAITAKTLTDIEANYVNSWAPFFIQTGSGLQTLNNSSGSTRTGSLFVFPVTLQAPVKFNQILIANSLSYVFSAFTNTVRNSYSSYFGIYSMYENTQLNLISSNSFSILETMSQNSSTAASITWNYPTTTHTTGYGYGSFPAGNLTGTAQVSSYISGTRLVGLQFGGEMSLSGGRYWIGLLSGRSTSGSSVVGLSHAGIIGQIINPINMAGTVSGMRPLGFGPGDWGNVNTSNTGWFGRHQMGFATATSMPNFGGTQIPTTLVLSQLGAVVANSIATVLPAVTFVST